MSNKIVAIYTRVSTSMQDPARQELDLRNWAARAGHMDLKVYTDTVSGMSRSRPALDALRKDVRQRNVGLVAVTELNRLARSTQHLLDMVAEFEALNCDLYVHNQALDTSTPSGRLFFRMMAVLGEFERDLIAERVQSGLGRIKDQIARDGHYRAKSGNVIQRLGRPGADPTRRAEAEKLLREGVLSPRKIAAQVGLGEGTVRRLKTEMAGTGT